VKVNYNKGTPEIKGNTECPFHELIKDLLKGKKMLKEAYALKRTFASQVLVYLMLSDLDRLWKPHLPHAVPLIYCYIGYSLPMDIARNLLNHVTKACTKRGYQIAAVSSDG